MSRALGSPRVASPGRERLTSETNPRAAQMPTAATQGLTRERGRAGATTGRPPLELPLIEGALVEPFDADMPMSREASVWSGRAAPCRAEAPGAKDAGLPARGSGRADLSGRRPHTPAGTAPLSYYALRSCGTADGRQPLRRGGAGRVAGTTRSCRVALSASASRRSSANRAICRSAVAMSHGSAAETSVSAEAADVARRSQCPSSPCASRSLSSSSAAC